MVFLPFRSKRFLIVMVLFSVIIFFLFLYTGNNSNSPANQKSSKSPAHKKPAIKSTKKKSKGKHLEKLFEDIIVPKENDSKEVAKKSSKLVKKLNKKGKSVEKKTVDVEGQRESSAANSLVSSKKKGVKRILYWNDWYGSRNFGFCCGGNPFKKAACNNTNCYTSKSRDEDLIQFDAIIFHSRSLNKDDLPKKRYPWQLYVFFTLEAPVYDTINYKDWDNFFNISMTYRTDSDVYMPYAYIEPSQSGNKSIDILAGKSADKSADILAGKSSLVVGFVSHCSTHSRREDLIAGLTQHLPPNSVNIYGSCGTLSCKRDPGTDPQQDSCLDMAGSHYKFYLSLENSICKDYVTEKLFGALRQNLVPIVLGGGDYETLLPPHSYINARDYPDPKALGDYLLYLDKHETEYLKYFAWKSSYIVKNSKSDRNKAHCTLCQFLHTNKETKIIEKLGEWWHDQSHCQVISASTDSTSTDLI